MEAGNEMSASRKVEIVLLSLLAIEALILIGKFT